MASTVTVRSGQPLLAKAAVCRAFRNQETVTLVGEGHDSPAVVEVAAALSGIAEVCSVSTDLSEKRRQPQVVLTVKRTGSLPRAEYIALQREASAHDPEFIAVGCYTEEMGHVRGKAVGMYVVGRPQEGWGSGEAAVVHSCPKELCGKNPTYVAVSHHHNCLYVCSEIDSAEDHSDAATHGARVLRMDRTTGELTLVNSRPTFDGACCHVALDAEERHALFANYVSPNCAVAIYSIAEDGSLGALTQRISHSPLPSRPIGGPGSRPHRQDGSHAHMVCLHRTRSGADVLYVPDLGHDAVYCYTFDAGAGTTKPLGEFALQPGDGPRHCAVHPDGSRIYVANELSSTCAVASIADDGQLTDSSRHDTAPPSVHKNDDKINTCAAIHVAADGGVVLVSNRGCDDVAVFSTHVRRKEGAELKRVSNVRAAAAREWKELEPGADGWRVTPRDFRVLLGGKVLLIASQNNDFINAVTQTADGSKGRAFGGRPKRATAPVRSPVCLCPV